MMLSAIHHHLISLVEKSQGHIPWLEVTDMELKRALLRDQ